jgi:hypothetical protein
LALDPDNAWPHAVLGIWHLEVVRHAGAELARDVYSASKEAGLEHCAAAERLAPGQIVLRFGCTVARLLLDPATYEQEAIRELILVSGLPAHDAAEHLVEERARDILEQLGGGATN